MSEVARLHILFDADGRPYVRGLKNLEKQTHDSASKMEQRFKKAGKFIQSGTDSGPGPHAGGTLVNGVENPGQHDYMTLTMLERDVRLAA